MRKNIKTCIYAVTAILPIVLSACSNKNNNMPKSTKESISTTFVEETSSDITNTTVEITTEKDTTELISETEQEVINSTENITEQQQTQINVQQTTAITSVNSTPAPITTTPRPTETTTPRSIEPTETITSPVMIEPKPDTPIEDNKLYKIKDVIGLNEKYTSDGIEFKINGLCFHDDDHSYFSLNISEFAIDKTISDEIESYYIPSYLYFKYEVYDSNGICVETDFCKVGTFKEYDLVFINMSNLPSTSYTIKLSNYQ